VRFIIRDSEAATAKHEYEGKIGPNELAPQPGDLIKIDHDRVYLVHTRCFNYDTAGVGTLVLYSSKTDLLPVAN
jgi:hypothetical protein